MSMRTAFGVVGIMVLVGSLHTPVRGTTPWNVGDVFVAVRNGMYHVYDNNGVFKEAISDGFGGFTTGCAFNPTLTRLYTTNFSNTKVVAFDDPSPHPIVQIVDTNVTSPGGHSESIVFAGNADYFVGHPDGNTVIHRYDAAGNLLAAFAVAVDDRGTDWMDLAANQTTLFYTSEGRAVQRFDVVAGQLANFAVLPGAGDAFALRLLPPGDGSGGLVVADGFEVKRLDGTGAVVQTYDVPGEDSWFALNLDPSGTSFWSANFSTANFYRFNVASGAIEAGPINTGTGPGTVFGVCVKGEITAPIQLAIEQADIEFSAATTRDNRMDFRGQIGLGVAFGNEDAVTVDIQSDSPAGVNQIDPVAIPAAAFQCMAGVCVAEVDDPSQSFMGESLNLEVTIPQSGMGEFKVQVKNVETDVSSPPVKVTLFLRVGNRAGTNTVVEVGKDPGKRLQFEKQ